MSPPLAVCDYQSALDFLLRQINYERTSAIPYRSGEFKLDRMRRLLSLLGDPHLAVRAVHIAGTKGKGSTAAMVSGILRAAGLRTGLYTSPHLDRLEERIVVDGQLCTERDFVQLTSELEIAVQDLADDAQFRQLGGPTFFEITTAMAFLYFARSAVDVAVLEVGLGGRLDSTNVCRPVVSIITSISFDHMRQLGSTLAAIAGEKAGIIKPGVPVVSGVTSAEPQAVVRAAASQAPAKLLERGTAFEAGMISYASPSTNGTPPALLPASRFDYWEPAADPVWRLDGATLSMPGSHQVHNAALAIAAAREMGRQGWELSAAAISRGLETARCPARIEMLGTRPTIILDVAHNVASIEALVQYLRQQSARPRGILVFASSKDKDTAGMLRVLLPEFDELIFTQYVNNPRAVETAALHELATSLARELGLDRLAIHTAAEPPAAWQIARQLATPSDLICITGSFFLAAELRSHVLREQTDNKTRVSP
jgi:dihydrofolate synthase/folylpolyglutamate synthase